MQMTSRATHGETRTEEAIMSDRMHATIACDEVHIEETGAK
jgi:hypothetical protein